MNNLCIIPARGGSKRILRKNIKDFLGKPIISYSIAAANESNLFDEVMVSTEDDEIAEIAYITMQEMGIEFAGVVDDENVGNKFFSREIQSLGDIKDIDYDYVVVATYLKRETIYKGLLKQGVAKKQIRIIFSI